MKRKAVITAISLALFMAPAAAFELNEGNLSEYKETANQHTDELPDFVKDLVGDQDINVYIDRNQSESHNISLQMNNTKVEEIQNQSLQQPDLEVWTSNDVMENISESEQPVQQMQTAIDNEEIRYEANDTWTKVKIFFAETFMNLL